MKNNKHIHLVVCIICLLSFGCSRRDVFVVKGVVAGAGGQTLYLENTGLSSIVMLDSIKLKSNGNFKFTHERPEYPDFYRLRVKNKWIHFSVDSTETVTITADLHTFATSYTLEGSENSKALKEITLAQLDANQQLKKLRDSHGINLIPDSTYTENVLNAVNSYKETVKKYIFGAPMSPAAYFALFQQIDGLGFYDLYDRTDSKAYGAVATNYKVHYPGSPRAKQLESLALQSLKITRGERLKQNNMPEIKEVGYIDIELPDINGQNVKLSDVAKGKTTLITFTAYRTEWSPTFNIKLNEVYEKYKEHGFDIYQVSLDNDVHFWKNAAVNIPWTSVYDPQSIHSSIAAIYNVRRLPTMFLLNKKGMMVKRIESVETIENDIKTAI